MEPSVRAAHRNFQYLWAGETLNLYVEQVVAFAAPLLIVTTLNGSVAQGQILTFLFFLPYLVFGLNAGVWLESTSKQRVVVLSALAQAVVLLAIWGVATFWHLDPWSLGGLVLVSGVIAVFFQIAYQSYLPTIYSDQASLLTGNARLALSDAVTRVAGPATAGWLLVAIGTRSTFGLLLGLMVVATLLFSRMRPDPRATVGTGPKERTGTLIRQGITFVREHPWLNPIISCGAYYIVFVTAIKTTVVLYLVTSDKASESVAGVVTACIAVGYGVGSELARRLVPRFGTRLTLQVSALVSVTGVAASTWASVTLESGAVAWLTGAAFLIHGIGDGIFAPTALSVRQVSTPPDLMSRVTSVHRFFIWGGMSLGAVAAAVLTAATGPRVALIVFGISVFGTLPVLYRKRLNLSKPEGTHGRDPEVALRNAERHPAE
ncbi:MFS transporter [Kineosporia sp. J2-2]|uniref:MFS transporter n=1 Tax=Kineosporia corallincola TaxID=2835133 RepID=A0ABS5TP92_9ACTN|nr:MFS transporter [Kineosporia corallincola]MBT0772923.1 MFS transporter [Kineosporia corallincola]